MDKKSAFRINNRTETTFGVASTLLGVTSILLFVTAVYQSAYGQLNPLAVGSIELMAIISALVGLVFGIVGETRLDKFRKTAHIGIVLNCLMAILHVVVLIQGY